MTNDSSVKIRIYLLFFLSGISGLIYEIVWLRILTRMLGSTVYATSIILASFMAGLAIGSYLIGKYGGSVKNQLRFYAFLEMGIGLSAMVLTFSFKGLMPVYKIIYSMAGGERLALTAFQSAAMFAILLIPATLMGGTLPALGAYTRRCENIFTKRVGYLYGLNTLGAVIGVLAGGIYLIGSAGETATLLIGVLINLTVSLAAFTISRDDATRDETAPDQMKSTGALRGSPASSLYDDGVRKLVLIVYGLNGFVMMSYEVIWSRIFQINIGTSIYAFSVMLAFYLAGISLGSLFGGRFAGKAKNTLSIFGSSQLFIALYGIIGIYIFTVFRSISVFSIDPDLENVLAMPILIILPVTFVSGFIFPIVSRGYVKGETDLRGAVGRLYAVNTLGCIAGSLITGFVFIELFGTRNTMLVLAGLNAIAGMIVCYNAFPGARRHWSKACAWSSLILAIILGILSPDPFMSALDKAVKRGLGKDFDKMKVSYHKEKTSATVTVLIKEGEYFRKWLLINGIGMTSLCVETKLMSHLPILFNQDPKDLLVVCFGMGTALRSALVYSQLRCDVVELVGAEYECFKYFHANGPEILADPRVHRYVDDGRNFLLMRPKKYDVITVDPSPPIHSAGAVNLYSKEFFELCRKRLRGGGVMCLWIPPWAFSEVRMIMKTFQAVFPNTYVYGGPYYPGFYMVGFIDDHKPPAFDRFFQADADKAVMDDLNEWSNNMPTARSMLDLLVLKPDQLARFVEDVPVITDDHPYTEFFLWRSVFDKTYQWQLNAVILNDLKNKLLE